MNYLAQSNLWRLEAAKPRQNANGTIAAGSNGKSRIMHRATQVFPFTLFPSQLVVEEHRIIWLKKLGPWMEEVISIMATDIASVNCTSGLLFGNVHVQSLTGGPEILIDNLPKKDVYKIMSLVEGIAMSAREGVKIEGQNLQEQKENLLAVGKIN